MSACFWQPHHLNIVGNTSLNECEWVWITFRPLDARMLVVTQEESFSAAALIAAHHVDTNLLASSVAFRTLVHICQKETHKHKLIKGTSRQNNYRIDSLLESCLRSNHYQFIGPRAVWNHVVPIRNRQKCASVRRLWTMNVLPVVDSALIGSSNGIFCCFKTNPSSKLSLQFVRILFYDANNFTLCSYSQINILIFLTEVL